MNYTLKIGMKMFNFLLNLSRNSKKIIALSIDTILIGIAYFGSFYIRFDNNSTFYSKSYWFIFLILLPTTLFCFIKLGLYNAILRYVTIKIMKAILVVSSISSIIMLIIAYALQISMPRSITILYFILLTIVITGVRLLFRIITTYDRDQKDNVIIYGAGDSGRQLLTALNQMNNYSAIAFIDDDEKLQKSYLHGVKIYSPELLPKLIEKYSVKKILLAMPSASMSRRKEIINALTYLSCEVLSIPKIEDIIAGKSKISTLNKVSIDDLLGREPIQPVPELLAANVANKIVMVTGAGGSIGSELCRQIITQKPKVLILFELSEFGLYAIESELNTRIKETHSDIELIPIIGTIQNKEHLSKIMRTFKVNTIYHAAAYKHVPLVEYNVIEGVKNNVFGTLNCAIAALESDVETFVLISTDKAVRPTNTMGTTKRVAELILQALAKQQSKTRFCMVRFGNVLGSSGSVVPLFKKQIEQGGPITLTHPEITRYFMTIPEASQLVIQAGAMGTGGDVFVLDMGDSVRIIDLARRMIQLNGLTEKSQSNPNGDIEIKISGLRPGEKLYEELLIGDNVHQTQHPRIMTAKEIMLDWNKLEPKLQELNDACNGYNLEKIRGLLLELPTSFNPVDGICDVIWKENNYSN